MKIKYTVDKHPYSDKETASKEFAGIKYRLEKVCDTPNSLIKYVKSGCAIAPALLAGGSSEKNWRSQQIIVADIDNARGHILQPADAVKIMSQYNISPYFMHHSFSSTEEKPKYHIYLLLDEAVRDVEQVKDLNKRFVAIFNNEYEHADTGATDAPRVFLGSTKDSIICADKAITPLKTLFNLPSIENSIDDNIKPKNSHRERHRGHKNKLEELREKFSEDLDNFDLKSYILNKYNLKLSSDKQHYNPCPICKHNDCFNFKRGNNALYYCHSSEHGRGGNIITFIQEEQGLDKGQAIEYVKYNIFGYNKNEWLRAYTQAERDKKMTAAGTRQIYEEEEHENDINENDINDMSDMSVWDYITTSFQADIKTFTENGEVSTGIKCIDKVSSLYAGLYIVGAISGLGKTTLMHQIADNIASQGFHTLYFSLEQTKFELVSKSLARTAYKNKLGELPAIDIRQGKKPDIIEKCIDLYTNDVNRYMNVIECEYGCDVDYIKNIITNYSEQHDCKPIIFIDYLQAFCLKQNDKGSTKDGIDEIVSALKDFTKAGYIVFLISSVSRANYYNKISIDSFKESGGIEYTCDVAWGLQPTCMREELFDSEHKTAQKKKRISAELKKETRKLELCILKNRFGRVGKSCLLDYMPAVDYFKPATEKKIKEVDEQTADKLKKSLESRLDNALMN